MSKPVVDKANFNAYLRKIRDFSNTLPANPKFEKFETEGTFWGFTNHQVTGSEMNDFVEKLQERLVVVNDVFRSIVKEFSEVYQVFEALDKEYVAGILRSLEEAHKAIIVAQKACDDNALTLEKLGNTVEKLLQVSDELSDFKKESSKRLNLIEQKVLVLDKCSKDIAQLQSHQNTLKKQYEEVYDLITLLRNKNIVDNINLLQAYINDHDVRLQSLSNKQNNDTFRFESKLRQQEEEMISQIEDLLAKQVLYQKKTIVAYIIGGVSLALSIAGICLSVM